MKTLANEKRIIYQIYPKSFMDSNHDGYGDLNGIISHLDYLHDLGVNTLWLNPIFVSPQVDNGYDVSNYFMIEPSLGTMDDFDHLITASHQLGMEVILDLVINHTSDQHPWFKDAISDSRSIYRDYYIWQPEKEKRPPNNWGSFFGGSVWEKDPAGSSDYYFHLFAKEMPDLNWKNHEVRLAMSDIGKFWLKHGVDGFRLDAFIHTAKANYAQDVVGTVDGQPQLAEEYYANLPQVQEYLEEFVESLREVKPDLFILGEAASADIDLVESYTDPHRSMCDSVVTFRYFADDQKQSFIPELPQYGQPHNLDLQKFQKTMIHWQTVLQDWSYPTLYWSNHDLPRILDKFGEHTQKDQRALAKCLAVLMYLQRGIPCIYYGEELAMTAGKLSKPTDFADEKVLDFIRVGLSGGFSQNELLKKASASHKIGARSVMQWTDGVNSGFSDQKPWLQAQGNGANVLLERKDPDSVLNFYRQVLALKSQQLYTSGSITFDVNYPDLYVYRRAAGKRYANIYCNLSEIEQQIKLPEDLIAGRVKLKNQAQLNRADQVLKLGAYGTIVIEVDK